MNQDPTTRDDEIQDSVETELRRQYPHGHRAFLGITLNELELHSLKNHDYAKGGHSLGNFQRVASILSNYPGLNLGDQKVVALVYALKQLDAVLWGFSQGIEHKVEGPMMRLRDMSVYSKIVQCMLQDEAGDRAVEQAKSTLNRYQQIARTNQEATNHLAARPHAPDDDAPW